MFYIVSMQIKSLSRTNAQSGRVISRGRNIVRLESRSVADSLKALSIDDDWRPIILYSSRVGDAAPLINRPEWFRSHRRILFRLSCCCCCRATWHTRWRIVSCRRCMRLQSIGKTISHGCGAMHYSDDGSASWHPWITVYRRDLFLLCGDFHAAGLNCRLNEMLWPRISPSVVLPRLAIAPTKFTEF